MSVRIDFSKIVKKYGKHVVIPELDLQVKEGEFFTLLGPSGCGKTTLLRMVAGFNSIEGGTISFNDKMINDLSPGKRNIGMVFQNYAVFPHLSVAKNVAFGLTNRKISKDEIEKRVDEVLKAVRIDSLKDRMPQNMSGGQQQRIALARAIVIRPDVLLMDEPLSNLDAKLRIEMREVIKEIQHDVGITTIYVTHDQEEAMAVSDRIAVMKDGLIQQVGTPRNIYHRPANIFVATFIGTSNILNGILQKKAKHWMLNIGSYQISVVNLRDMDGSLEPETVSVSIRPEEFYISTSGEGIPGVIKSSTFLGTSMHYQVEIETGEHVMIVEESKEEDTLGAGNSIRLRIKEEKINIYDASGEVNYSKGVEGGYEQSKTV
ncbi:MAG: ABC transporter ATP-binding protein [Lachnospiraceae bacterium]